MTDVNRWTPGAGGGKANNCYTKLCEARGDLYPMLFFAFVITGQLLNSPVRPQYHGSPNILFSRGCCVAVRWLRLAVIA